MGELLQAKQHVFKVLVEVWLSKAKACQLSLRMAYIWLEFRWKLCNVVLLSEWVQRVNMLDSAFLWSSNSRLCVLVNVQCRFHDGSAGITVIASTFCCRFLFAEISVTAHRWHTQYHTILSLGQVRYKIFGSPRSHQKNPLDAWPCTVWRRIVSLRIAFATRWSVSHTCGVR